MGQPKHARPEGERDITIKQDSDFATTFYHRYNEKSVVIFPQVMAAISQGDLAPKQRLFTPMVAGLNMLRDGEVDEISDAFNITIAIKQIAYHSCPDHGGHLQYKGEPLFDEEFNRMFDHAARIIIDEICQQVTEGNVSQRTKDDLLKSVCLGKETMMQQYASEKPEPFTEEEKQALRDKNEEFVKNINPTLVNSVHQSIQHLLKQIISVMTALEKDLFDNTEQVEQYRITFYNENLSNAKGTC